MCSAQASQTIPQLPPEPNLSVRPPNGGWGWMIVLASFIISFVGDGFTYNIGIFYDKFLQVYGESETSTSLFYSTMTGMESFIGPLASSISILYGCRVASVVGTILTVVGMLLSTVLNYNMLCHTINLGLITGIGLGLTFLPQVTIVNYWFDRRLATATGISVCGSGFGIATFGYLMPKLVDAYDWKVAMIILAAVQSISILCSFTFVMPPTPPEQSLTMVVTSTQEKPKDGKTLEKLTIVQPSLTKSEPKQEKQQTKATELLVQMFDKKMLSDFVFNYFLLANFIGSLVYYIPVVIVEDRIYQMGLGTSDDRAMLMVYYGVVNGIARTVAGYLTDLPGVNRNIVYGLAILGLGGSMACSNLVGTIGLMKLCYCIYAVAEGFHSCLNSVVLDDMFGTENVSSCFGIILFFDGVAAVAGPPLITHLSALWQQREKDYAFQIWLSVGFFLISGILLLLTPLVECAMKKRRNNKKMLNNNQNNGHINPVLDIQSIRVIDSNQTHLTSTLPNDDDENVDNTRF